MAVLLTPPELQFFDNNGLPLAGGLVYTYLAGTTTPQATYTDAGGATPNANPVVLDAAGRANIWINGSYKIIVKDSAGVTITTNDNITSFNTTSTNINSLLPSQTGNGGKFLQTDGTNVSWSSAASSFANTGYATNRYYYGLFTANAGSGSSYVANRLYYIPFSIGSSTTFTKIGLTVTTLGAGNARIGIYNMSNGVPTSLVLDAGTVSVSTTGDKEVTINQAMSPGIYALAVVTNVTAGFNDANALSGLANYISGDTGSATAQELGYASFAYAALPSTFGAVVYNNASPIMWMRV